MEGWAGVPTGLMTREGGAVGIIVATAAGEYWTPLT